MATAPPTPSPQQPPSPHQQPSPSGPGGQPQGGPPPELQALAQLMKMCQQLAQQIPATSAGLAKAIQGINEAASAVLTQPQQQAPQQSPPY